MKSGGIGPSLRLLSMRTRTARASAEAGKAVAETAAPARKLRRFIKRNPSGIRAQSIRIRTIFSLVNQMNPNYRLGTPDFDCRRIERGHCQSDMRIIRNSKSFLWNPE